ncbi:CPBP family intramembrane glutamic endopeptidase [Cellulomonas septica]|uniref:CPBP family intramembrane metalloprotease n=1 Tax=Cellulomonas septica TaxID=285080 RepID=A0ABX1K521_9CELL|nr:CPBP family intramembrane glutamic endopeptidase [Cellulomonas septica]NKY40083.1 CPBP family intramembrane metalloprotease [Cellulomonas septica]
MTSTPRAPRSRWQAFWDRGGIGRAVLVAAAYLALYVAGGLLVGRLFGDRVDADDLFSSAESVVFGLLVPLVLGAVALVAFVTSVRWWGPLFGAQPVRGRRWMWIAPVLVVVPVVLRLLGIDYGAYAAGVVAVTLLAGLFVGFVEELLTRGLVVKMLRDSGRSEWVVMVVSSLVFALLHSVNLLSGMSLTTVGVTVVYTFAFGVAMYLTLRVTGSLLWPVLLHGLFDPTLFLATGGIDRTAEGTAANPLLTLAGPFNMLFIVLGVVALFLARAVNARRTDAAPGTATRGGTSPDATGPEPAADRPVA